MLGVMLALVLAPDVLGQQLNLGDICRIGVESWGKCSEISGCPGGEGSKVFCDESKNIVCCPEVPRFRPVCKSSAGRQKRKNPEPNYVHGGRVAQRHEFPHLAAIGYDSFGEITWECGGALITANFVLTAAHCLEKHKRKAQWVRLGDIDLKDHSDDQNAQTIAVLEHHAHPDYKPKMLHHDIGLLELEDPAILGPEAAALACLGVSRSIPNLKPIVAGWGETEEGHLRKDQKLRKAELEFQPIDKCVEVKNRFSITNMELVLPGGFSEDAMVCAGKLEGGVDSCAGDSGGPLQLRMNATDCIYNIVAVTSFGYKCGVAEAPAIYTRVSHYVPWIESIVCSANE